MKTMSIVEPNGVNSLTHLVRMGHRAGNWLATQFWGWEGGDAIVVLAGYHPNVETWVYIRSGATAQAVQARGVKDAMRQIGINAEEFEVA